MKTKMTARVLSLVIALVTMLTLCFVLAAPASAENFEVGTMEALQKAIADAKSGDVIYLKNDITLTASETITIANKEITITSQGDAIYTITRAVGGFPMFTLNWGATVTLTNVTIDGNNVDSAGNGGAFGVDKSEAGRVLIIGEGATLKNLKATNGGAAYMRTVIMNGGTIKDCTAGTNGGGLYVDAQFTMNGGTITGNTAGSTGGGVYVYVRAETTFAGGWITDNDAETGGGVTLGGTKTTVISGTTISGNKTTSSFGGGIYLGAGTLQVTGGEISGNTATGNGGGIYLGGGSNHALTGGTISSNTGKSGGGVAHAAGTTLTVGGGCTITGNTSTGDGTDVGGGGVYATGTSTVTVLGGEISGNTAVRGGGMLLLCNATISGGEIKNNTATKVGGGGLYLAGDGKTVTIEGNTVISGNTIEAADGGGIYLKNIALTITGGTISGNTANRGGGIAVASGTLDMSSGEVKGNVALIGSEKGHGGAGLYVVGTATLSGNAAIIENKINNLDKGYAKGGGIFVTASGILTIQDTVKVDNNFVAACTLSGMSYGGGIYNNGGFVVMDGGSISGNLAYNNSNCTYGGGIYNQGVFIMNGGSVNGNVIMSGNGARYNRGGAVANDTSATFWMTGGEMCGNRALGVGSEGGAIYAKGGVVYVTGGTVTDNGMAYTSKKHGGAMYISVTAYLAGGEFYENHHYKTTIKSTALTADAKGNYSEDCALVSFVRNPDGSMEIKTVASERSGSTETSRNEYTITVTGATTGNTQSQINVGATAYLGATITLAEALGDDVKVALKNVTVSKDGLTVTTANRLNISSQTAQPAFINNTAEKLILASALVDGSYVAMADSAAAFMGVADGVTDVDGICLLGADKAYAPTLAEGALTWPADACQAYQNAGLQDNIAYRLYWAYRDASNKTLPTVTFDGETVELGTVSSSLATLIKEPYYEGLTYVEVRLAPKQISETISVVLGEETKTYTLADYLNVIKEAGGTLGALVNATLNYGTAAQAYFGETEDRANANYKAGIADITAASERVLNQFADKNLPLFKSASVVLGDKVSVKIIIEQWVENFQYSVTLGGVPYTPTTKYDEANGRFMIVIENISACDLADRIEVTMTKGENTATLDYSVLDYAISKQGVTERGLDYVVKALYAYANAAAAYVAPN